MNPKQNIQNELKYILDNLKKDTEILEDMEDKIYLELTKKEIVDIFHNIYFKLKKWSKYIDINHYDILYYEYKNIERNISELELCLTDYDNILHIEGISYSFVKIGKELSNLKKGSNQNE